MITLRILVTASLLVSGAAAAKSSAEAAPGLPRSTPEEQGVSSAAILGFVADAEQKVDALHSLMILRHGHVVAEGWWSPYAAAEPHVLFSLSKSFTSTAVGLAVSEGKLSLDDTVLKFFPGEAPAFPSKNLQSMRVRDLLRMSTGHRAEDIRDFPFEGKSDLARVFLELPVPDIPGTHFVYNTAATYMLSAIVQKVTGQTVLDYLGPRLFDPLGIARPRWDASAQGVSLGGYGLSVRTEDIARFGQLYLQKGQWQGRRLIPSAWVEEATSLQTANGSDPASDWNQGYGYQFWRCRHGFYRGDGAFGQFCFVLEQYDAVIAVTSGTGDMQGVMNVVWDKLLPAFSPSALPADPENDRRLSEKLASLSLPTQQGAAASSSSQGFAGRRYLFPDNPQKIEAVSLEPAKNGADAVLEIRIAGADQRIECGRGAWAKGTITLDPGETFPEAASGAWTSDDTYSVTLYRYQTPFRTTYDFRFAGDELILEALENVSLAAAPSRIRLVGTLKP